MERKIISVDISPDTNDVIYEGKAGVMWEHNATEIVFNIDERYRGDYKYYIEYRSILGTKVRTEYLMLDTSANTITYAVPVSMSSLRGVECYFNIVSVDGDGNTVQVIKPRKFYLEFDYSPDTDNYIAKVNDFSVNALLEAIKNGTFRGEKGDKGDPYTLTDSDCENIAKRITGDIYGLPYIREFKASGKFPLTAVLENGVVRELEAFAKPSDFSSVSEEAPARLSPVSKMKLVFGKNEIEYLLKPEMYTEFKIRPEIYTKTYYVAQLNLKPNTKYACVRYSKKVNACSSVIKYGESKTSFISHGGNAAMCKDYLEFTSDETGVAYLAATLVGSDEAKYSQILDGTFYGLGIYEYEKFALVTFEPENPFYSISEENGDTAELISGKISHNIVPFAVPSSFDAEKISSYTSGDTVIYCYELPLTVTPDGGIDYDVVSTHYKTTVCAIESDSDLTALIESGESLCGVYFNRVTGNIYIRTEKNPDAFSSFVTAQNENGTPVTVLYRMKYPIETEREAVSLTINPQYENIVGLPESASYHMKVNGSISDALNTVLNNALM